jgi:hypothetical protein
MTDIQRLISLCMGVILIVLFHQCKAIGRLQGIGAWRRQIKMPMDGNILIGSMSPHGFQRPNHPIVSEFIVSMPYD